MIKSVADAWPPLCDTCGRGTIDEKSASGAPGVPAIYGNKELLGGMSLSPLPLSLSLSLARRREIPDYARTRVGCASGKRALATPSM